MLQEYSKMSKEELVQEIMASSEIEVSDRCFANEVFAGTTAMHINRMFELINDLDKKFSYKKADELKEAARDAQKAWDFIKAELHEMNDNGRAPAKLKDFRERVARATDPDDSI